MTDVNEIEAGELLFCGGTDWVTMGKKVDLKDRTEYPHLPGPHRLASMKGIQITFIASGSASCHCVAIDIDGRCYTWGRNESGQLGHGDFKTRHIPTVVSKLSEFKVIKAATGRHHTLVVTEDGSAYAFGSNQQGQLGTGSLRKDTESSPVKSSVSEVVDVACGAEFSMWLTKKEGSTIMSAGLPQYGQLGHGTDNMYNAKESSVKIVYEPQPLPRSISALSKLKITRVACGNNHTVASDSDGFVYTWGFGGHGRLGHKVQKDEWLPRQVEVFKRANVVLANGVIAAGSAFSACTAGGGQLYMWGKVKSTGENAMYPKANMDLSGWNIRSLHCGNTTSAAAADDSCITWGTALYGELGYGENGPKSSANPKKVDSLELLRTLRVACGVGHSLFVVSTSQHPEIVENLPVFEPNFDAIEEDDASVEISDNEKEDVSKKVVGRGGKGRPATTAIRGRPAKRGGGRGRSKKDDSDEEEEESGDSSGSDEDAQDEEFDVKKKTASGRGRARGRGRGTARGRGSRK